jgi:hypothetical protein
MMKKVFEPGEVELADPRGDPNRVIDIQKKIKELLEANPQRQAGIIDEIREEGAWALPGLLNATYVWMNHFENNKPAQKIMAKILAELAKENDSAVTLLVDSGVLENPFKTPREIALQALEELNWNPSLEQIAKINSQIQSQKKSEDIEGILLSYHLLARSGDEKTFNSMLKQCTDWSVQNTGDAAILLGLLVKYYPESAIKTLSNVFIATKNMYKEKKLAAMLVEAIRPIPPSWWLDFTIINISINVLNECNPPRHTGIEYLFKNAAQDAKQNLPQFWAINSEKVNTLLFEATKSLNDDIAKTITRYWFQSLGSVTNNFDLIVDAALSEFEPWGTSAALQLFFLRGEHGKERKNKDIKGAVEEALNKLVSENDSRYNRAEADYSNISSKNKGETEMKTTSKSAGLTDH